ncbi:putative DNA mismatch repair protein Msh6 [Chionoecetes opilio]|uniref:Putative DNA mismatch repair protein Msh6 n=1 Tax=Chionoecetes opilio TaxID=41210 RepID=A0A8J4XWS2_CHIOP|nr:putative DNA mismatch repair protein Msh6 [Chionoecetes opilio]
MAGVVVMSRPCPPWRGAAKQRSIIDLIEAVVLRENTSDLERMLAKEAGVTAGAEPPGAPDTPPSTLGRYRCPSLHSAQGLRHNHGGRRQVPLLDAALSFFDTTFDHLEAQKEGKIVPRAGVDAEYDEALEQISATKQELAVYLKEQGRFFSTKVGVSLYSLCG